MIKKIKSLMRHCVRCGYSWMSRTAKPKCCPNCMSRLWNLKGESNAKKQSRLAA